MTFDDIKLDFKKLKKLNVPSKRAAYSDRTAWLMAILSEIAYVNFNETADEVILNYAKLICEITYQDGYSSEVINSILNKFSKELKQLHKNEDENGSKQDDTKLNILLKLGGFKLAGAPIDNELTDTQAFVAIPLKNEESETNENDENLKFAVICFRGTQQPEDMLTNINFTKVFVKDPIDESTNIGKMHRGFHEAYKSVECEINKRLDGNEHLPIYITGHSLGGALAVVATWYQSMQRLAACYTFGAPRVGNSGLIGRFRTPIYRVVNGGDPIPKLPPAGRWYSLIKIFFRTFSIFSFIPNIVEWVINKQGFRHYGDIRYITYDFFKRNIRVRSQVKTCDKFKQFLVNCFIRTINRITRNQAKTNGILKYHEIAEYRKNLRLIAIERNLRRTKKCEDCCETEKDS